jgi:uncharacterized protein
VSSEPPELADLERFRQSGLRLDAEGRWWHEGQEVTHAGLKRGFHRWLDRLEDGRYVLRLDQQRYVYVDVDDAPFIVRTLIISLKGDSLQTVTLKLSDESEEALDFAHLRIASSGVFYCRVKGDFEARFSRQAWQLLAAHLEEREAGYGVEVGGTWFVLKEAGD